MTKKPSTGLGKSCPLTAEGIDKELEKDRIGVYVLGYTKKGAFYIQYVGRSDTCVNTRLHDWVGQKYKRFKFGYRKTKKAAFEKECTIWHDFEYLQKHQQHPDRPDGTDYSCPARGCGALD